MQSCSDRRATLLRGIWRTCYSIDDGHFCRWFWHRITYLKERLSPYSPPQFHRQHSQNSISQAQSRKNIMQFSTAAILTALASAPLASTLGINCRGSLFCTVIGGNTPQLLFNQLNWYESSPRTRLYTNGQNIACFNEVSFLPIFLIIIPCLTLPTPGLLKAS